MGWQTESSERMAEVEHINDSFVFLLYSKSICTVLIRSGWGVLEDFFFFCGVIFRLLVAIKCTSGE